MATYNWDDLEPQEQSMLEAAMAGREWSSAEVFRNAELHALNNARQKAQRLNVARLTALQIDKPDKDDTPDTEDLPSTDCIHDPAPPPPGMARTSDKAYANWRVALDEMWTLAADKPIRADVIRAALTDNIRTETDQNLKIDPRGLHINGAVIKNGLDLRGVEFKLPSRLVACRFDQPILLRNARLGPVRLDDSRFPQLDAEMARIDGDFDLRYIAASSIKARGLDCCGVLALQGARLMLPAGVALNCDSAETGNSVFLRDGFTAQGELNFRGATIGGTLECDGARFSGESGRAFICDTAKTGGAVFLRSGFAAEGQVNFIGAAIGGALDCDNGRFSNENGRALICDAAVIGSDVFLRDGFSAKGEVNFVRAKIGGNVHAFDGTFRPSNKEWLNALDFDGGRIGGGLFLLGADIEGDIDLSDARAQTYTDGFGRTDNKVKAEFDLDGFQYERFADDLRGRPMNLNVEARNEWLGMQSSRHLGKDFRPQPWLQCAKALRAMGHERDARILCFERERLRHDYLLEKALSGEGASFLDRLKRLGEYLLRGLLRVFAGFGYRLHRAAVWAGVLMVLGIPIYSLAFQAHMMRPAQPAEITADAYVERGALSADYPIFRSVLYSVDVFVPILDLKQESYWLPRQWGEAPRKLTRACAPGVVAEDCIALSAPAETNRETDSDEKTEVIAAVATVVREAPQSLIRKIHYRRFVAPAAPPQTEPPVEPAPPPDTQPPTTPNSAAQAAAAGWLNITDAFRIFQIIMGWVLTTIVIAGFTGLLQRKE